MKHRVLLVVHSCVTNLSGAQSSLLLGTWSREAEMVVACVVMADVQLVCFVQRLFLLPGMLRCGISVAWLLGVAHSEHGCLVCHEERHNLSCVDWCL